MVDINASISIRINSQTRDRLKAAADKAHKSMSAMIDDLLVIWERDQFRKELWDSLKEFRENPQVREDYWRDVAAWDAIPLQGVDDGPELSEEDWFGAS